MLTFNNVNAFYGANQILTDVCFSLEPGCITALLGKNGAGKSTLLGCIAGQTACHGEISLNGQPLYAMTPRERARQIALLPQRLPEVPLTVRELAELGRSPYLDFAGRLTPQDHQAVTQALDDAGALWDQDRPVCQLSGGERQKAFLAMILAQQTPILLFDEPTTFLDIRRRSALFALMQRLKRQTGKTMLVVLHDLAEAIDLADRILLLENGRIAYDGDADGCLSSGVLERVFGVEKQIFHKNDRRYVFFSDDPSARSHNPD